MLFVVSMVFIIVIVYIFYILCICIFFNFIQYFLSYDYNILYTVIIAYQLLNRNFSSVIYYHKPEFITKKVRKFALLIFKIG